MPTSDHVLLIVSGGIAAFKALELVRALRRDGVEVTPVLTRSGAQFVTPLSLSALAGRRVYTELFDLTDEAEMGHIQLSRAADLVVVAPCTADLLARMALGLCDDLATTLLLATDKRVLIAPAMNVRMWSHPATQRNLAALGADGVAIVGPDAGEMACGEYGPGRLAEVPAIMEAIRSELRRSTPAGTGMWNPPGDDAAPLSGRRILVTSGPTHEPIDPVRYIANRSSGAQGSAIGAALADLGADVTFVTGPAEVPPPPGVHVVAVETAVQMLAAVRAALPSDAAIFAAAVADWHVVGAGDAKLSKDAAGPPALKLAENPDILSEVAHMTDGRPTLVVGFAAETGDVVARATAKRRRKGCDWILANDVSPGSGVMGGTQNAVTLIEDAGSETWPRMPKGEVARRLAHRIAAALQETGPVPGA